MADFLVMDLIGAAAPGKGQGTQMTVGEALARADAAIDRRFAAEPLLAATIHHRMGETYWNLQDKPKAERHLRAAAGLRRAPRPGRPRDAPVPAAVVRRPAGHGRSAAGGAGDRRGRPGAAAARPGPGGPRHTRDHGGDRWVPDPLGR